MTPKSRIRIVKSRGHLYAQEVHYKWDSTRKRGVTVVIRTLGPLSPKLRRRDRVVSPQHIHALLKRQAEEPKEKLAGTLLTETNGRTKEVERCGESESKESKHVKREKSTSKVSRSLTGDDGLEEFDKRMVEILRNLGQPMSRSEVFDAVLQSKVASPNNMQSLRRHVSFALSRLHRAGLLTRRGAGSEENPEDPYRYSVAQGVTPSR